MQADNRGGYFRSILGKVVSSWQEKCGENGRHNKFAVHLTITPELGMLERNVGYLYVAWILPSPMINFRGAHDNSVVLKKTSEQAYSK